ncbi:SOS response-associated peptidase family protein [Massilia sp. SR12]
MCTNYKTTSRDLVQAMMEVELPEDWTWPVDIYRDYRAPVIRQAADGRREALLASFGMVPKARIPAGSKDFATMNARFESVGERHSYKFAWRRSQLCLVPMTAFDEPCYESGAAVWWGIGMADQSPFAVAGLWNEWQTAEGPQHSFTQLTVNADEHPLMRRFHKPGEEKRSIVIVPEAEWDNWLGCRNPEIARSFMTLFPAERMTSWPAPRPKKTRKTEAPPASDAAPAQADLF